MTLNYREHLLFILTRTCWLLSVFLSCIRKKTLRLCGKLSLLYNLDSKNNNFFENLSFIENIDYLSKTILVFDKFELLSKTYSYFSRTWFFAVLSIFSIIIKSSRQFSDILDKPQHSRQNLKFSINCQFIENLVL